MSVQYEVIFQNNSTLSGDVCVYQTDPDINVQGVMSLAWFAKPTHPTTVESFKWTIDYDFVWDETGELIPGVVFEASQTWPADLSTTNQVSFTYSGNAYTFSNQTEGPSDGNLYILEDATIPVNNEASVGIGMSGSGTFVCQASPNITLNFTPHPTYWITFGNYTQGQVLDITETTQVAEIAFPANVYSMTATLNENNTWTVAPTVIS